MNKKRNRNGNVKKGSNRCERRVAAVGCRWSGEVEVGLQTADIRERRAAGCRCRLSAVGGQTKRAGSCTESACTLADVQLHEEPLLLQTHTLLATFTLLSSTVHHRTQIHRGD